MAFQTLQFFLVGLELPVTLNIVLNREDQQDIMVPKYFDLKT